MFNICHGCTIQLYAQQLANADCTIATGVPIQAILSALSRCTSRSTLTWFVPWMSCGQWWHKCILLLHATIQMVHSNWSFLSWWWWGSVSICDPERRGHYQPVSSRSLARKKDRLLMERNVSICLMNAGHGFTSPFFLQSADSQRHRYDHDKNWSIKVCSD